MKIIISGPAARLAATQRTARQAIFSGVMLRRTVLLWIGFGCLMAALNFANKWTPKLISDATGDPTLGVTAGVLVTAGGVVGRSRRLMAVIRIRCSGRSALVAL